MIMALDTAAPWAGVLAASWLVVFQLLLAGGAPLGFLAWGGQEPGRLSRGRRIASLASAVLMAGFAALFGQAAGLWSLLPEPLPRWPFIFGVGLFSLSTLGNVVTKSRPERWHGVPLVVALTLACGVLAFSG